MKLSKSCSHSSTGISTAEISDMVMIMNFDAIFTSLVLSWTILTTCCKRSLLRLNKNNARVILWPFYAKGNQKLLRNVINLETPFKLTAHFSSLSFALFWKMLYCCCSVRNAGKDLLPSFLSATGSLLSNVPLFIHFSYMVIFLLLVSRPFGYATHTHTEEIVFCSIYF